MLVLYSGTSPLHTAGRGASRPATPRSWSTTPVSMSYRYHWATTRATGATCSVAPSELSQESTRASTQMLISDIDRKRLELLNGTWRHDASSSGKEVKLRVRDAGSNKTVIQVIDCFRNIVEYELLLSYETPVAMATFDYGVKLYRTTGKYSQTTSKHINQWVQMWLDYYADDPEELEELKENVYNVTPEFLEGMIIFGRSNNG